MDQHDANMKAQRKSDFQYAVRRLRETAQDRREDMELEVERGHDPMNVYKLNGQDLAKEFDPKLHALMVACGDSRKALHDYVLAHVEGKDREAK